MLGPTAAAKSETAMALASAVGGRIVSVDSMQVYRGMDIGTAKPSAADRETIEHGMIDLADPETEYSAAEFQAAARAFMATKASSPLIIVGGSGLHFRAVVDPMTFPPTDPQLRTDLEARPHAVNRSALVEADPTAGDHVDLANPRRVMRALEVWHLTGRTPTVRASSSEARRLAEYDSDVPFRAVGLDPGSELASRARRRVELMREQGFFSEVQSLCGRLGRTARQAVGYRQLTMAVEGLMTVDEAFSQTIHATIRLAKRQRTFFRRDPRITWLEWSDDPDDRLRRAMTTLEMQSQ